MTNIKLKLGIFSFKSLKQSSIKFASPFRYMRDGLSELTCKPELRATLVHSKQNCLLQTEHLKLYRYLQKNFNNEV